MSDVAWRAALRALSPQIFFKNVYEYVSHHDTTYMYRLSRRAASRRVGRPPSGRWSSDAARQVRSVHCPLRSVGPDAVSVCRACRDRRLVSSISKDRTYVDTLLDYASTVCTRGDGTPPLFYIYSNTACRAPPPVVSSISKDRTYVDTLLDYASTVCTRDPSFIIYTDSFIVSREPSRLRPVSEHFSLLASSPPGSAPPLL